MYLEHTSRHYNNHPSVKPQRCLVFHELQIISDDKRHRIVRNVKKVHQRIIVYFGKHALDIYGLPPDLERVDINFSNYKNILHWCER